MKPKATLRNFLALAGSSLLAMSSASAEIYYWDNNGATTGFGAATGTWDAAGTVGSATLGWGTVATGLIAPTGTITTASTNATTDALNFGTASAGLTGGTITVAGTVAAGNITFGAASGAITLSGGTAINLTAASTITVNNATNTIGTALAGAGTSFTKAGTGILILTGVNGYTGTTIIRGGTLQVGTGTTGSLNGTTGTALTFSGTGTFNVREAAGVSQGMGALTLSAGDATITSTWNNGVGNSNTALTFASLAARSAGATVNFTLAGTGSTATNNRIALGSGPAYANAPLTTTSNNAGMFFGGSNYARYNATTNTFGAVIYGTNTNANTSLSGNANTTLGTIGASVDSQFVGAATTTTTASAQLTGLTTLTVASGAAFKIGQLITGTGITADTIVTGISGNVLTLSQAAGVIGAGAVMTPYTSISAQTTDSLNTLNLSGPGATLTLAAGQTLSVNGILRTAGVAATTLGSINGGTGIQTVASGGEMVIRTDLATDVLNIRTAILDNGTSSLTKSGAGTLTLSGTNTFSGATTVNSGQLNITGTNSANGGFVINGGTLFVGSTASFGSNNITVNGTGFLLAAGATSTNGGITLNSGALSIATNNSNVTVNGAVTGEGTLVVAASGSGGNVINLNSTANTFTGGVDFSNANNQNATLNVNSFVDSATAGAGNIRFNVTGGNNAHTFNLASGAITGLTLTNRQFELAGANNTPSQISNSSGHAFTINSNLLASGTGTRTLTLGGTGAGLSTFAGTITNGNLTTLSLTKAGAGGTWVLTNTANTYNGTTAITGGTLGFVSGVLGSGGPINASGGTLLWLAGNTEDISSRLAMTAATDSTFNTYNNNVTFASAFGSSTTGRLVKTGLGTLTLQGNNTYTGATTISGGGTLVLDYSTNNGSKIGNAALNLSGGNLLLRGNSLAAQAVSSIVIAANTGNSISRDSSTATIANAGVLTMNANSNLTIAEAGIVSTTTANVNGIQILGVVTVGSHFATRDAGGLLQAYGAYNPVTTAGGGVNTVVNQLSGGGNMAATLNSYALRIVNNANDNILDLGTNRNLALANGGTLLYAGGFNDNYTINGSGSSAIRAGSGNQTTNVNVLTGTLTINALLGSNANSAVTKSGAGTLVVGGANSARSGAASTTYIQQGVFRLANDFGLGDSTGGTIVQGGAALELSQTTALTPLDITVGAEALSITGTGISNGGALRNHTGSNTYGGLITIGAGGARINANAATSLALTGGVATSLLNDVTFGGAGNTTVSTTAISGVGNLIKDGAGTLTLSATNTYTGTTTVGGGAGSKLIVNGNISTSILTTVQTGATLGGTGTVGALTVNSGAFHTPGNSPGIQNTGNYSNAGTLGIEINSATVGTGYDQVNTTGTVSLSGLLSVTMGYTPAENALFFILANDGSDAIAGTFSNATTNGGTYTFGGQAFRISYFGNQTSPGFGTFTGGNDVVLMAIPEPSTALLGAIGLLALLRRRR